MTHKRFVSTTFSTDRFTIEELTTPDYNSYYSIVIPDSVVVIPLTTSGKLVLVKQFRPPINEFTLEFPSGYVNQCEDPFSAANRELTEETGYNCLTLKSLGEFRLCPSRINYTIHAFCGIKAELNSNIKQPELEVILLTPDDFERNIYDNCFNESTGIAIYFIAKNKNLIP